jgi:hypothetical protein
MSSPLRLSIGQTPHVDGRRSAPARVFGWILAVAGVALVLLGADEARRVSPALTWPTTAGQVDSAGISSDTVATSVGKWRNYPVVEQRFHVAYRYRVGGVEYRGRRLDLLPASRRDARADLQRYPGGTAVSVRYDPERPANAVLEASRPLRALLTAAVGTALLLLGRRLARRRAALSARAA